ncbi:hypothetical protein KUTeg_000725 [Tegillarca granosa]|uniref:Uncharacterized protein n=1 Tax=Tegillarca granosa TaxID=220873 RepID=A0ABQ9FYD5_TEGGR|nr:hypothetical protein KUTeg_000725 [Tegillarca granosa]
MKNKNKQDYEIQQSLGLVMSFNIPTRACFEFDRQSKSCSFRSHPRKLKYSKGQFKASSNSPRQPSVHGRAKKSKEKYEQVLFQLLVSKILINARFWDNFLAHLHYMPYYLLS